MFLSFFLKKIDITNKAVAEILSKATEYLQPNPGKVRKCLEIFSCSFTDSNNRVLLSITDSNNQYLLSVWLT